MPEEPRKARGDPFADPGSRPAHVPRRRRAQGAGPLAEPRPGGGAARPRPQARGACRLLPLASPAALAVPARPSVLEFAAQLPQVLGPSAVSGGTAIPGSLSLPGPSSSAGPGGSGRRLRPRTPLGTQPGPTGPRLPPQAWALNRGAHIRSSDSQFCPQAWQLRKAWPRPRLTAGGRLSPLRRSHTLRPGPSPGRGSHSYPAAQTGPSGPHLPSKALPTP